MHLMCDLEVKGHKYQGQTSHGSRSNKDTKQRQVGSQQRQVASFTSQSLPAAHVSLTCKNQ